MEEWKKRISEEWDINASSGIFQEASKFYDNLVLSAKTMFGYPANNVALSLKTQYLLLMHYNAPFSNNCGDIEERGYYSMDTKDVEKRIVGIFAEKFDMGKNFWGYVTSGGSESNSCGIALAFAKNPDGILYYSQAAHYSVEKSARMYKHIEIPTIGQDVMDLEILFKTVLENYQKYKTPANFVLTHGTTQYGVCDDVDAIVAFLRKHQIPYYIHLDAALFGGIPNNQTGAPLIKNAKERGIDSVSVSLHKYLGFPDVHSVFVAAVKPSGEKIAYIGQHDTTISGSRSLPAYALYNHILEQFEGQDPSLYQKNVCVFEDMLKRQNVSFYRAEKSNIFVVDAPNEEVCKKYQLSCFYEKADGKDRKKAHIIIFPSHKENEMKSLATDLI